MWLEIFKWIVDAFYDYRKFKTSEDIVKASNVFFDNAIDYENLVKSGMHQDDVMKDFFKQYNEGKYGPRNLKEFKEAHHNKTRMHSTKEQIKEQLVKSFKNAKKKHIEQWIKSVAKLDKNNKYNQYFWDQLDEMEMSEEGYANFQKELEAFENNTQDLGGTYWLTLDKHSDRAINRIVVNANPDESQYTYDIDMEFYQKKKSKFYTFNAVPFAIIVVMISYTMTEMLPSGYLAGALHFFRNSYWKEN